MKKILFLGLTEELAPLVKLARSAGYLIYATDRNEQCYGRQIADKMFFVDALDKTMVLSIAKKNQIDAITTRTEMLLSTVAYVCQKLGLFGVSELVAEASNDKYAFRQYIKQNSNFINSPSFFLAETPKDHAKIESYPVVIKPIDYSGSAGVTLINSATEFERYFESTLQFSRAHKAIVESYIDGTEFSVETVSQNGKTHILAITQKGIISHDNLVEQRHIIDGRINGTINQEQRELISNQVLAMAEVLGFNNCIGHTEIKLSSKGPVIIETAARPGGDSIAFRLVELATGINMYENMFNLSINKPVNTTQTLFQCSGIQFITSDNYSSIIKAKDIALNSPYLVSYKIDESFDVNQTTHKSTDRGGEFIFCAPTQALLEKALNFYK